MTSAAEALAIDDLRPVPLDAIERELSGRMKALQAPGEAPVTRVHMSNLVIYCDRTDQAAAITEQVPAIAAIHPARVLLLIGEANTNYSDLTATVHVRSHRVGNERVVCSEQVTLHARGLKVDRLPYAVRGLSIGDLPTNLWWAANSPPPLAAALLFELAENTQQIIYDSLGWLDPIHGVAVTGAWLGKSEAGKRWNVISDLNWRRLKYWRRLVGQAIDPATAPGALESITEVLVEHGPHAVVQAWELTSWLTAKLGWKVQAGKVQPGVEIAWQFVAPHGTVRVRIHRQNEGPAEISRVRIACALAGNPGALSLIRVDERHLSLISEGSDVAPRTLTVQPQSVTELIGRQLSDRERDPLFRESMSVARSLAQSVSNRS